MRTRIAAVAAMTVLVAGAAAEAAQVYASGVYAAPGSGQATGNAVRFGPSNALGPADGDFFSLGIGGRAIFTFGGDILGPGTVIEITYNCNAGVVTCSHYRETAEVFGVVGPFNPADYLVGEIVPGIAKYDFAGLALNPLGNIGNAEAQTPGFSFDTNGNTYVGLFIKDTSSNNGDGFDVASVSATPAPVPLPPAAALLVGALGGLGLVRGRGV